MIGAYPFRIGDEIRVSVRASVTDAARLFVRVRYVDGGDDLIEIDITHSVGDRTNEIKKSPDLFEKAGWVEHLTVDTGLLNARGRFYMMVAINREPHHFPIAAGYIDIPHVPLGEFEPALSGSGFLSWVQIANDISGNVNTTYPLALPNARRVFEAILIKYHCDDAVFDRTPFVRLRDIGDVTGPTGFGTNHDHWNQTGPSLQADQIGSIYVGKDGFIAINDNGALTFVNNATAPHPLPLEAEPATEGNFLISITNGQAGDDYDAFVLVEEWISP